jgi:hypothetical protein
VPVPEDPEERAALAPDVIEFRRNQLRVPQEESNLPGILGAAALGATALIGGLAAARGLGFGRAKAPASKVPNLTSKGEQNIRNIDSIVKQHAAERLAQEARQERPEGIVLTSLPPANKTNVGSATLPSAVGIVNPETKGYQVVDPWTAEDIASRSVRQQEPPQEAYITPSRRQEVYEQVASKPASELPRVYRPKGGLEDIVSDPDQGNVLITDPNTGEIFMRGASPSSFAETYIRTEPVSEVALQALGALESGEDQMTGRIMRGVMRNEDLDSSQVNEVARQTGSAEVAASMTPDGAPVDQTTFSFREKVYLQPGQKIQQQTRRVESWRKPTDVTLIGRYPAVQEQTSFPERGAFPRSLGESGGETILFTPVNPYQGRTNIQRGGVEFTVQEGRIAGIPARVTVLPRGTESEGRLGPAVTPTETINPEQVAAKIAEFQISKEAQIQSAMEKGLSEARARRNVQMTESQRAAIEADLPGYSPEDVMSRTGVKGYGDVADAERYAEEMASKTGRLKALEEGGFLEEQVDPGELRQGARQVRPGVMIRPASKTSYRGMTGRPGVGIYGEQAPGRPGEPGFGAGAVEASKIIKVEGEERGVTTPRPFIRGVDLPEYETPEGFVYTEEALTQPTKAKGGYKRYGTQPPTRPEAAADALNISLELTRLQREGKTEEAQAFLDKIMQERGVSSVGPSQPLRQRMSGGRFTP